MIVGVEVLDYMIQLFGTELHTLQYASDLHIHQFLSDALCRTGSLVAAVVDVSFLTFTDKGIATVTAGQEASVEKVVTKGFDVFATVQNILNPVVYILCDQGLVDAS